MKLLNHFCLRTRSPWCVRTPPGIIVGKNNGAEKTLIVLPAFQRKQVRAENGSFPFWPSVLTLSELCLYHGSVTYQPDLFLLFHGHVTTSSLLSWFIFLCQKAEAILQVGEKKVPQSSISMPTPSQKSVLRNSVTQTQVSMIPFLRLLRLLPNCSLYPPWSLQLGTSSDT